MGRLSPIPSLALEADWVYATDLPVTLITETSTNNQTQEQQQLHGQTLDQLAGALDDNLTLQTEFIQGSVLGASGRSLKFLCV